MKKYTGVKLILILFICALSSCQDVEVLPKTDVVLVGAGIMSASVGSLLQELDPNLHIQVFERLDQIAQESSEAWNNAGTGHAAYCELTYTAQNPDKSFDLSKAVAINEGFEVSKEYWAFLVESGKLQNPREFINNAPHISFVFGESNVHYLKARFDAMKDHPLFRGMEFSDDPSKIAQWAPLIMEKRPKEQKVAATYMAAGTDINFGAITKGLISSMQKNSNFHMNLEHEVTDFEQNSDGTWWVYVTDKKTNKPKKILTKFVFLGAGGGSLPLLQKTKIPEGKKFAGFPVGGEWLVSSKEKLVERHLAKVYGKASIGSPPMSVPHLDTRYIDGKRFILFGPFATFSTKFLKNGSAFDILASFRIHNAWPMFQVAFDNISLISYLISQVMLSKEGKMKALREYFPAAVDEDWYTLQAGQRVQIIKNHKTKGGILEFGTKVVSSKDGTMVALLGASPGASISMNIALSVLKKAFAPQMGSELWMKKLKSMIPSYDVALAKDEGLMKFVYERNKKFLGIVQ